MKKFLILFSLCICNSILSQNQIIVGPQNDCALKNIKRNVHTSSEWFDVTGVAKLKITTFQHRTYDKSRIYNEAGDLIWGWLGESYSDTWYKKEHFLDINTNKIKVEFTQGYNDPFCDGFVKVEKFNFNSQKSNNQDVNMLSAQNGGNQKNNNISSIHSVNFENFLNRFNSINSSNSTFSGTINPYPSNPSESFYKTDYSNNQISYQGFMKEVITGTSGNTVYKSIYKHGTGKEYFTNSNGYLEGFFINNKLNGYGVQVSDGYSYRGYYVNGDKNGEGILVSDGLNGTTKYIYEGNFSNNKFNGKGVLIYDFMAFMGEFINGEMKFGIAYYPNGIKYVGAMVNGMYQGTGEYYWNNGNVYKGDFKDGKFHGKGELEYSNGTIQKGIYENGNYVGEEKQITQNDSNLISNNNQQLNTNKFPNSKFEDLTIDGRTIKSKLEKSFLDLYSKAFAMHTKNSLLNKSTNDAADYLENGILELKETVDGWLGGPMTDLQVAEFLEINKTTMNEVTSSLGLVSSLMKNSGSSSSSSKPSTFNAWQCSSCGTISHLDRKPRDNEFGGYGGCNGASRHDWRQF